MREHPRDHLAAPALDRADSLELLGEEPDELGREVHQARLVRLGLARVEPERPGLEVDVAALEGQHFALHPPAERVGERHGHLEGWAQAGPDRRELAGLEEAGPRRRFLEESDHGEPERVSGDPAA